MKYLSKFLFLSALAFTLGSCEKDENKIYFEDGKAPVLTSSVTTIPIAFANADKEAVKFSWTNPDYRFTTGGSSQNVNYLLEIDTTGSNFTNPKRRTIAVQSGLSRTIMQGELNDYLLNTLELKPAMAHNIEIRVTSSLSGSAVPLTSNVLKFVITPYTIPPKVTPPGTPVGNPPTTWVNGRLFIVGNATPGGDATGWNNPVPEPSQEFTKLSPTLYEITIPLIAGKSYLLLPVNGSWSEKYGFIGNGNTNNADGDEFKAGGNDFKAPAVSGNYRIVANFQTGRFTVTKL